MVLASSNTCCLCGEAIDPNIKYPHPMSATVDHRISRADGGSALAYSNLGPSHKVCNEKKGTQSQSTATSRHW